MTGSPYWLGLGGVWVNLDGIDPGIKYAANRPSSEAIYLGGKRRRQRAARAARTWELQLATHTEDSIQFLAYAASGLAGEVWLYDQAAAQINMLDPRDCVGRDATQPTVLVGIVPMPTFADGYAITRKLREGVAYWLGGWSSHTAAAEVATYDIGDGPVSVIMPAGTGPRAFSTSFTPDADVDLELVVTEPGVTSGLRLTEGGTDQFSFALGKNTPCRVSIDDPTEVLQWVLEDGRPLSDFTVTIAEVG